ncbi:Ig-like domain-containing protein [Pseudomonas fitomaticsae]|uniref:Ig-like domain repeat protein n=1 Tax=Pseudomonas fitomaticsae TaxID=2837969 RepID=A0ABY3PYP3_9PSED|nr:hypothetical protein [Pseudomonas fitomaticsae]UFP99042.1 hypothetical protein KJY40_23850 [Pseudomonas fitomaticsae]
MDTTDDDVNDEPFAELSGAPLSGNTESSSEDPDSHADNSDPAVPFITDSPITAPGPKAFIARTRGYQVIGRNMGIFNSIQMDFHGPNNEFHTKTVRDAFRYTTEFDLGAGQHEIHYRKHADNQWKEWYNSTPFFAANPPLITTPPGTVFPTTTPTITGTGQAGAKVQLWRNGMPHSSVSYVSGTSGVGTWSLTTYTSSEGSLTVSVREEYTGWEGRIESSPVSFTITLPVADPFIDDPKPNQVITVANPTISGRGQNGASIDIWRQGGAGGIYGTGTVQGTGWRVTLTKPLPNGQFIFHAEQITSSGNRKWSTPVPVEVRLKPGTLLIANPPANSIVNRTFDVSGIGGAAGADIKVMLDLQDRVVGATRAQGDSWSASVTLPDDVPPGEIRLACEQILNGIPSDRSLYRPFKLSPPQPTKLTVQVDAQSKVTLGGVGHIGATFHLHVLGNMTPFHSFTVATSPWTVLFPDWLPSFSLVVGRQSVPDSAGQPIYSGWTPESTTVVVPVPRPTLSFRVSPDGIPTFSGTGRNWAGQPASRVEVRLNYNGDVIVPIVDVRADMTWSSTATARWAPGTYEVSAIQRFAELPSPWSVPVFVVIPAPPAVIEKVTPNGLFAKVVGQCWPGAELTITFGDNPASHPVADTDKDGQWDFQRPAAFRPGTHTVTVTQTFGGQTSHPVSLSFDIAVKVLVITPPPGGQTDHLPVLQGIGGIEGFTIRVFDFVTHEQLGETLATGDDWSVPLKELDYGSHTVFAVQELGGLQSQPSTPVTFDVVLSAPRIDFPKTGTSVPRTFTVEGYARAGKGFDRTEVEVYLDDAPHRVYPNFADGYFKQQFTRPLGPCVLKARQYFKDQESPLSQDVLVTIVPDKALIETPAMGEAVGRTATICGFGYPEDTVVVALPDGSELGQAAVQGDGTWFCLVELPGTGTDLSLVTEQRKGEYRSGWSEPWPVPLLAAPPTFDEPGEGKWEGATPEFAGGALAESRVDVVAWYDADKKHANALVTNGGRWAGASERNLPAGPQWARAVQVVDGKRSMPADSKRFEIAPSDEPPRRHPTPE